MKKLNLSFQFNVKRSQHPSVGIQYDMEDESQENRNYESTDFVCFDTDADRNTDIKAYFDEPIADGAWL